MIYQVEGDILLSQADALVHGVGINDPMDEGLALALRTRYPDMHRDFLRWCHQHNTRPGEAWAWQTADHRHIVNLIVQDMIDRHEYHLGKATLSNVKHALDALAKLIARETFTSIAVSRLGTGSGDLDWDDVWPLIEAGLGQLEIPVYVYSGYRAGQKAEEPGS